VTAGLHAAQAAVILYFVAGLGLTKRTPVHIPYVTWPDRNAPPCKQHFGYGMYKDGSIDIGYCIFGFFMLSATFQLIAAWPLWNKYIDLLLDWYVQPFRWIEYSVSASLMAVIYALLSGIQETTFIYNIFISFFTVMMLGLLQEIGMATIKRRQWEREDAGEKQKAIVGTPYLVAFLPHLLGWIVFIGVVSVFAVAFFLATTQPGKPKPPTWVYGLYISQFIVMGSFAFVQIWEQVRLLHAQTRSECMRLALRSEFAYTILSLAAKSSLCWVLFVYLLAEKSIDYNAPAASCGVTVVG